jgi:hypothetical protein
MQIKPIVIFCLLIAVSLNIRGQEQKEVLITTEGYNFYPSISPNGKFIAYLRMIEEDMGAVAILSVYNLKTGEKTEVENLPIYEYYDSYPRWTHDSKNIFFSSGNSLYSYNIITNEISKILQPETKSISFFAPNPSPSSNLIAFWIFGTYENKLIHSVWVFDQIHRTILRLPKMTYGAETETVWLFPQWISNDTIVATYFPDSISTNILKIIELSSEKELVIDRNLYSTYFKVINHNVFYTKSINKEVVLFCYNILDGKRVEIIKNLNGVFDIYGIDSTQVILFSWNDSLYALYKKHTYPLKISGSNPQLQNNLLVYEKWVKAKKELVNLIVAKKIRIEEYIDIY